MKDKTKFFYGVVLRWNESSKKKNRIVDILKKKNKWEHVIVGISCRKWSSSEIVVSFKVLEKKNPPKFLASPFRRFGKRMNKAHMSMLYVRWGHKDFHLQTGRGATKTVLRWL